MATDGYEKVLEKVRSGEVQPWWNLDEYFVAHLAEQLTLLRDEGHGVPLRFANDEHDPKDWNAYLTKLIGWLEEYDVDDALKYANAQQALHEFAAYLRDFWD